VSRACCIEYCTDFWIVGCCVQSTLAVAVSLTTCKPCCYQFNQFAEQYGEEDIGDLAHEEIEGYIRPDSERVDMLVSNFEKRQKKV
jgi:hypothetical protein